MSVAIDSARYAYRLYNSIVFQLAVNHFCYVNHKMGVLLQMEFFEVLCELNYHTLNPN